MSRQEVLELAIFDHGPGANSTCRNVVAAPVFLRDIYGQFRPRINMTENRVSIRENKLSKFGITTAEVRESLTSLRQAFDDPRNQHLVKLKRGQVIAFSGEVPHGRTAFAVNSREPRYILRLHGTSRKHCKLITERQLLNPEIPARYPGM